MPAIPDTTFAEDIAPLPIHSDLWQQTLQWQPSPSQQQQFQQLYAAIVTGNRQLNLTRITEPDDFWEKHLWDSLTGIAPWLNQPESPLQVLDIGTGAGFPGVPVAIACPTWRVTLLDSTRKKISFLESCVTELGLAQVTPVWGRAEALAMAWVNRFDLVLLRAVAAAPVCAGYALPLLKPGGQAVLYRGQWSQSEAESLEAFLAKHKSKLVAVHEWHTPLHASQRHCVVIEKGEISKPHRITPEVVSR
jgi:16S rRNA (guanine527-N7)-methyltransferase